jgi:hypothetical protein
MIELAPGAVIGDRLRVRLELTGAHHPPDKDGVAAR